MSVKLEYFFHPMCPFSQRVLYVISYKNIDCTLHEIDLSSLPKWFLEKNPSGVVPELQITRGTDVFKLSSSLAICEYLDSFPGPPLYPRLASNEADPLEKTLINTQISSLIEPLRKQIGLIYYNKSPKPNEISQFQKTISLVNSSLANSNYFMNSLLRKDEFSMADLMALPLIDRVLAFKDQNLPMYQGLDLANVINWHSKIVNLKFVQPFYQPLHRFLKLRQDIQSGDYKGLVLPATYYDSPKI